MSVTARQLKLFAAMVVLIVAALSLVAITPYAIAQTNSDSASNTSSSTSASSNSSAGSVTKADSAVLRMRLLAQEVAKTQNEYQSVTYGENPDKFMAVTEQMKQYFTTEFSSQASPWYQLSGAWYFSGTRMTNEELYQAIWTCVADDGAILAYARGTYLDSQNKFIDVRHADTMFGLQSRPSSGDEGMDETVAGIQALMDQIEALHGGQPAPEREDRYSEDADYDEVQKALRESEESDVAKDWFREHGVYD